MFFVPFSAMRSPLSVMCYGLTVTCKLSVVETFHDANECNQLHDLGGQHARVPADLAHIVTLVSGVKTQLNDLLKGNTGGYTEVQDNPKLFIRPSGQTFSPETSTYPPPPSLRHHFYPFAQDTTPNFEFFLLVV